MTKLREFLRVDLCTGPTPYEVTENSDAGNYRQQLIRYSSQEGDPISAFLLQPKNPMGAAVLVHHQHNGERHLGKSEVAGLVGNPLQAFGPALANRGITVLAPDSICFEDRRPGVKGTAPDGDRDWLQHFNEMAYRLIKGDTLMRKVLGDVSISYSLLLGLSEIDPARAGVLGHSYGGNTAVFQAAIDPRVKFACASGAVCSFRNKMKEQTGLEMALVVPELLKHFEMDDILAAIAPREFLIVSATEDPYSKDADDVVSSAAEKCKTLGTSTKFKHLRYQGGHALTQERFDAIVDWVSYHRDLTP